MDRRLVCMVILLLVSCGQLKEPARSGGAAGLSASSPARLTAVTTTETRLLRQASCTGSFVAHTLDHTTTVHGDAIRLFNSNGAGVAINDLDNDGWLDLVFADLKGEATILWNQGSLAFRRDTLDARHTRAVNIVDVDGDGWQDLVFTHRAAGITYWRNAGTDAGSRAARFVRTRLRDVSQPAYAMNWADLNGDGSLDLVTGAYDVELAKELRDSFMFGDGAGVFYYEQQADRFVRQRLAQESQTLAIGFPDLNQDGRADLLIGNDFGTRDQAWLHAASGWDSAESFAATAHSTMSFDHGDIDNDGVAELFATDMKPFDIDTQTLAAWLPIMASMATTHEQGDPQVMENVLQVRGAHGRWKNEAYTRGVDATGWSWSGKFGDLDNDGFLDLYVVNGMIAKELFAHLPNDELIEANQALQNDGTGHFEVASHWGLGSTASGRGMSMADLDHDGDLDIVVNNLRAPAQLFENQVCGGAGFEVELRWPQSKNRFGIGAQLVLHTTAGSYTRDVRVASGYLSGDPARIHIGFPADAGLQRLDVRWPDGELSSIDTLHAQTLMTVTRAR
ncbi:MAG: CRTAC1 family protein [Chloroflexota bacterium]|nr:CRTAC1 family protein [Chloroflexota bacterium]